MDLRLFENFIDWALSQADLRLYWPGPGVKVELFRFDLPPIEY